MNFSLGVYLLWTGELITRLSTVTQLLFFASHMSMIIRLLSYTPKWFICLFTVFLNALAEEYLKYVNQFIFVKPKGL